LVALDGTQEWPHPHSSGDLWDCNCSQIYPRARKRPQTLEYFPENLKLGRIFADKQAKSAGENC